LLLQANVDMVVAVESYTYELQLALVAQGRGLSLVPEHILRRSRLRPRLRTLRISGLDFPLTVWMVFREPFTGFEPVIAELSRALRKVMTADSRRQIGALESRTVT
jgi:DNA-binding transcriptional LysR family regulator